MGIIHLGSGVAIGRNQPCFIIAEIGQNHQGDINIAKRLIDIAKECGADCVKFQKSCLEEKFTQSVLARPYTSEHSWGKTYGEHKQHLEFNNEEYKELQQYAKNRNILFTASAMDSVSLKILSSMDVPFIKIGSGDSDNLLLMEEAAQLQIPLVISTGMQDLKGVRRVVSVVGKHHENFALLHCVSAYPTPIQEANLRAVTTLMVEFPEVQIGYSGHEEGYNLTLAAVALGAKVVERHVTLDKNWKGNDHKCSLLPQELKDMIVAVKEIESALGDGVKTQMKCEIPCMEKLGKTVVAARNLNAKHVLTKNDLKVKVASAPGPRPHELDKFIGRWLTRDIKEEDVIRWDCVK